MPALRATVAYLYAEDHLGTGIKKDDLRGFGVGPAGNVGVCDATSAAIVAPAERVSSSAAVPDVPTLGLARPALFLLEKRVEGQLERQALAGAGYRSLRCTPLLFPVTPPPVRGLARTAAVGCE